MTKPFVSWDTETGHLPAVVEAALNSIYQTAFLPAKYGAVGDGVTNDTTAMQATLDAAAVSGGTVRLSPRNYLITSVVIPAGVTLEGAGMGRSALLGFVTISTNAIVRDLRIGADGQRSTFTGGATGATVERVHFKGGSGSANFYLNDSKATDCTFSDCLFTDNVNGGNGVQIVDKGTALKHYENIVFKRCTFRNNARMNFECIQRNDGAPYPVVSGYARIDLLDCVFEVSGSINVSYDSELLTDLSARSSGYSRVSRCRITGGNYGLELAGAICMHISDN